MPNIAQALKAEISRISRKEVKAATAKLKTQNSELRKAVSQLIKRVAALEKDNGRLLALVEKKNKQSKKLTAKDIDKIRITAQTIKSLRKKTGLSQKDFAKLVKSSNQSVSHWETSKGVLQLRKKTKAAIASLKGVGKREAKKRLAEV